jgi:hypothetical protein
VVSRVKDPDLLDDELERPLYASAPVTDAELERDEQSFMAFAAAMGVSPPRSQALPSATGPGRK